MSDGWTRGPEGWTYSYTVPAKLAAEVVASVKGFAARHSITEAEAWAQFEEMVSTDLGQQMQQALSPPKQGR